MSVPLMALVSVVILLRSSGGTGRAGAMVGRRRSPQDFRASRYNPRITAIGGDRQAHTLTPWRIVGEKLAP
jgi:hypothetical protein